MLGILAIKLQVLELARQLDKGEKLIVYSRINKRQLINILDDFINSKRNKYGQNGSQKGKFSRNTRGWDMFNQLYDYLKSCK